MHHRAMPKLLDYTPIVGTINVRKSNALLENLFGHLIDRENREAQLTISKLQEVISAKWNHDIPNHCFGTASNFKDTRMSK